MKLLIVLAVVSLAYKTHATNYLGNYGDLLNELSYLYEVEKTLPVDKYAETDYYPETTFDARSPDDWEMNYADPSPKDTRDYGEAVLRDPEFMKQLPISGYQFISGGTGREQADEVKTDRVLPAYCTPPNPCPHGYTGGDNCVKNFENSPENNHKLLMEQECPCDAEHMLNCPVGKKTIDPKSGYVDVNDLNSLNLADSDFMTTGSKRRHMVAKKSPQYIQKRSAGIREQKQKEIAEINPYLKGAKMSVVAKKAIFMNRNGV